MVQYGILVLLAVLLATAAPFILYRLSQNPLPLFYAFLVATVINAWTVTPRPFGFVLNLYLYDFCALACLACFALRLFQGHILSLFEPATLLLIVLTVSFFRGFAGYGTAAGVDYRLYAHALAAVVFFTTYQLTPEQFGKIRRAWIIMAGLLTLIALWRWGVDALSLPFERTWEGAGAENKIRVMGSGEALAIAMGAVAVLAGGRRVAGWRSLLLGNILLLTVLVLQHRSVWIATTVGLIVLALLAKRARPILLKQAGIAAVFVPFFLAIAVAGGMDTSKLTGSIVKSYESAVKGEGTVGAREMSWQALLAGYNRAQTVDKILGAPMGSGYLRFTDGIYDPRVQFSPHNFYLQVLLRGGILGALLLLVTIGVAVARAVGTARREGGPVSQWLAAAALMSLAFWIPYGAFVPTGLALGLAQSRRPTS